MRVDNMTLLAYLRRYGGRIPALNEIIDSMLRAIIQLQLHLSSSFVASADNEADEPSRRRTRSHDYSLSAAAFDYIVARLGRPTFDLFASRLTNKVARFASWRPDPTATCTDAFSFDWACEALPYAFPPPRLLLRTLTHARACRSRLLLVHPQWPASIAAPLIRVLPSHASLTLDDELSTLIPGAAPRDCLLPGNRVVPLRATLFDFTALPPLTSS
jgi:hypothetical protein